MALTNHVINYDRRSGSESRRASVQAVASTRTPSRVSSSLGVHKNFFSRFFIESSKTWLVINLRAPSYTNSTAARLSARAEAKHAKSAKEGSRQVFLGVLGDLAVQLFKNS